MSCLVNCIKISKRYSFKPLFENLSFSLHQGEKLGLLGNNGTGKSTLLKIIAGLEPADSGEVAKMRGLKIAYIAQFPEFKDKPLITLLIENSQDAPEEALILAKSLLSQGGLDEQAQSAHQLSGGQKKKLDILRAFMQDPDVLLLDEPTNHLDLESVLWLEQFLQKTSKTLVIVSHDRYFLDRVCKNFIEISRMFPEGNFQHEGTLEEFFETKKVWLDGELKRMQTLSHKVEHEIAWMKRSPKARTTKSTHRSDKALKLSSELQNLKFQLSTHKADLSLTASYRETRQLRKGKNLTKSIKDRVLFKGLELTLIPGKRIGLLGSNGSGKTTLFKILTGEIKPDQGTLKYADQLEIVYFDQHKEQLEATLSVKDALCPSGEFVEYHGQKIHVHGWAKRFLFSQDALKLPIKNLSGGERSRLLIARLMLKKADVLLLDEPTNDLDIQTLEVLEESLTDFPGALMVISHDRSFLKNVCNEFLALTLKPEGAVFVDFDQWEKAQTPTKKPVKETKEKASVKSNPLSSKEQKELRSIEGSITSLEGKIHELSQQLENPGLNLNAEEKRAIYSQLGSFHMEIETLFSRWDELNQKAHQPPS